MIFNNKIFKAFSLLFHIPIAIPSFDFSQNEININAKSKSAAFFLNLHVFKFADRC